MLYDNILNIDIHRYNYNATVDTLIVVDILQTYNCRISEVLNLKKSDIIDDKIIVLHGAKHSNDVIIRDRYIIDAVLSLAKYRMDKIFIHTTYRKVYNYLSNIFAANNIPIRGNKYRKVTHYYRYKIANMINDDKILTQVLYHRQNKNNIYYKQSLRRS